MTEPSPAVRLVRAPALTDQVGHACASVVGRSGLVAVGEVVHAAFGDHDVPSTLLGVAVLGLPRPARRGTRTR